MTARAIRLDAASAEVIQNRFRHDAARGVARTQKEHVERLLQTHTHKQHAPPLAAWIEAVSGAGRQHAPFASAFSAAGLVAAPYTGTESSVRNVSHAMPCGSVIQYLSERA